MKTKLIITTFALLLIAAPAHAQNLYNVTDGNISDWGVTFDANGWKKGYLDTHLPTGKNDVDFVTEDNADKKSGNINVGPGYSNGNQYDAEAMYFDNDKNYGYIAIVTGLSPNETAYPAGDIFLDTGYFQNSGNPADKALYQYVIDIQESKLYRLSGDASHTSAWIGATVYPESNPWRATDNNSKRTFISDVVLNYSPTAVQNHYFLETVFPLASIGYSANPGDPTRDLWMHWTMKCGNDALNLKGDVNPTVPEPSSLSLLLTGLGLGFRRLKNKKQ